MVLGSYSIWTKSKAFTLTEVMVSSLLMLGVLAAGLFLLFQGKDQFGLLQTRSEQKRSVDQLVKTIRQDLSKAVTLRGSSEDYLSAVWIQNERAEDPNNKELRVLVESAANLSVPVSLRQEQDSSIWLDFFFRNIPGELDDNQDLISFFSESLNGLNSFYLTSANSKIIVHRDSTKPTTTTNQTISIPLIGSDTEAQSNGFLRFNALSLSELEAAEYQLTNLSQVSYQLLGSKIIRKEGIKEQTLAKDVNHWDLEVIFENIRDKQVFSFPHDNPVDGPLCEECLGIDWNDAIKMFLSVEFASNSDKATRTSTLLSSLGSSSFDRIPIVIRSHGVERQTAASQSSSLCIRDNPDSICNPECQGFWEGQEDESLRSLGNPDSAACRCIMEPAEDGGRGTPTFPNINEEARNHESLRWANGGNLNPENHRLTACFEYEGCSSFVAQRFQPWVQPYVALACTAQCVPRHYQDIDSNGNTQTFTIIDERSQPKQINMTAIRDIIESGRSDPMNEHRLDCFQFNNCGFLAEMITPDLANDPQDPWQARCSCLTSRISPDGVGRPSARGDVRNHTSQYDWNFLCGSNSSGNFNCPNLRNEDGSFNLYDEELNPTGARKEDMAICNCLDSALSVNSSDGIDEARSLDWDTRPSRTEYLQQLSEDQRSDEDALANAYNALGFTANISTDLVPVTRSVEITYSYLDELGTEHSSTETMSCGAALSDWAQEGLSCCTAYTGDQSTDCNSGSRDYRSAISDSRYSSYETFCSPGCDGVQDPATRAMVLRIRQAITNTTGCLPATCRAPNWGNAACPGQDENDNDGIAFVDNQ